MKPTSTYNKSSIMRNAWRHFRCCFNITFADALRWAWNRAKEDRKNEEANAKRAAEYEKKYGKQDRYFANLYKDAVFGRTDYAVSYGRKYRAY